MSALRDNRGGTVRLLDPHTLQPVPRVPVWVAPAPRQPVRLPHLTDEQVRLAVEGTTSLDAAAVVLGTSQASLSRRLRQMRGGAAKD